MPSSSNQRIRVLLIAPAMNILGGQAVQAQRLLESLRREPSLEMGFLALGPPLPGVWNNIRFLRTIMRLALYNARLIRAARRYDILHVFSAGLWSYTLWTLPALAVAKVYRKKTVLNYRDGQAELHLKWPLTKTTIRMADVVVTPSGFLVDVFARHGIPARSIFNIIDLARFQYRQRRKLRPVFMTNRILEPLYNVDCILRAFALIQQRYPEASLTIAHDGVCRPALERLARVLKLRHTEFIGRVPHDRVPPLYDAADIYLTSPNWDCMPGSLLECFASGLPVIATSAGGIPYIARDGETALLVNLNDHQAMAHAAFRLLEDEELVLRLTTAARAEVQKYDWPPIRDNWLATYREFQGGPRSF